MKKDFHPTYYTNATISCACGNILHVGSTKEKLDVEICANCHPFYTGKEKLIDTAGRVDKFKKRVAKATESKKPASKAKSGGKKARK